MTAAATADLQRPDRVDVADLVRGLDEDPVRLGGRAEVDLDVPPQARDVAEQQRVGRSPSRAAVSRTRARAAWPHAQALRAAANVEPGAPGRVGRTGPPRARTPPAPRRTRRAAGPGRRRARGRRPRPSSGPSAAAARCHASRSGSPTPARASARARCAAPPVRRRSRPGRSPSAPAGAAPRQRLAVRRAARSRRPPRSALLVRGPGRPTARRSTSSSPVSSAAASSSSDCTGSGSRRLRSRNDLLDVRGEVQLGRQRRGRRASWSALSSPGSSSRASGLPRVSTMSRSAHLRRRAPTQLLVEQGTGRVRVEAGQRPARGAPAGRTGRAAPSRAANTMTTRSAPSRRAQKSSASGRGRVEPVRVVDDAQHEVLLGRGGQHRQGRDAHQERLDRRARRPRRTPPAAPGPAAPGGRSRSRVTGRSSRWSAANASGASTSRPWVRSTVASAASATSASSRADLPTPGSPRTTRLPADPCRARSTSASRRARSGSRPTSTARPYYRCPHPPGPDRTRRFDRGDARPSQQADRTLGGMPHPTTTPGGTPCTTTVPTAPTAARRRRPAHRAPSHRAAPLRRGRGARRRRPLGGAVLLDAAAPRGRLGRLLPAPPTAGRSSAPRPSSSARTTRRRRPAARRPHPPRRPRHPADAARPRSPGLGPRAARRPSR